MLLRVDTSNIGFKGTYTLEMIEEDFITGKRAVTILNITVVEK